MSARNYVAVCFTNYSTEQISGFLLFFVQVFSVLVGCS